MTPATTQRARELTDWFPAEVEPVREGVYQMHNTSTGTIFFARWVRQGWCIGCLRIADAASFNRLSVVQMRWPWRGLTQEAKC